MVGITRNALLLETSVGPVHVVVHSDADAASRDTAVLLLPPFGWDDVCSYRPRRDWADALAADGYVALRFSFPSAGDSGGMPGDPDRLAAWTTSLRETGRWLCDAYARPRLAVIGIELSGLLACQAIAEGMAVDDLVLWAAPGTGRQFLRRMQALSSLEATADETASEPGPEAGRGLLAGGFLLTEQTLADLRALDVATMEGLREKIPRAMLLGRDALAPENRLRTHLLDAGVEVDRGGGAGYSAMTAPSFEAVAPQATIDEVGAWLNARSGGCEVAPPIPPVPAGPVPVPVDGPAIVEHQIALEGPHGPLAGVLTEAADAGPGGLCALFLNTGTIRRIGPSRIWVEASRRWAQQGVRSVRFDLDGLGDSDGDPMPYRDLRKLYDPWLIDQVTSVMSQLHEARQADRFMLVGLSAGAYWAMHAGLQDERVAAIALINPGALIWDPGESPLSDFRQMRTIARTRTLSLATIRKALGRRGLALGVWLVRALVNTLMHRRDSEQMIVGRGEELRVAIGKLLAMRARRLIVLCDDEPTLTDFEDLGMTGQIASTPGVTLVRIASNDHTIRPAWAQRELHAALDTLLAQTMSDAP